MGFELPSAKRDPSIYRGDKVQIFTGSDVRAVNVDAPGLQHHEVFTDGREVR